MSTMDLSYQDWMQDAHCNNSLEDPEIYFVADEELAKRVAVSCQRNCPVVSECLTYALESNEEFGVWGGMTTRERKRLQKSRIRNKCPRCSSYHIDTEKTRSYISVCMSCGVTWYTRSPRNYKPVV